MAQNSQVSERNGISVTLQASELPAGPVTKFGTIVGDGEGGGQESSPVPAPAVIKETFKNPGTCLPHPSLI